MVMRDREKQTDRDSIPTCKAFVRSVAVLFLAFIVCIKCMEPLSFESPAEPDVVRRLPKSAKVLVSTSAGTRTRNLPHGNYIYIYIYIYI